MSAKKKIMRMRSGFEKIRICQSYRVGNGGLDSAALTFNCSSNPLNLIIFMSNLAMAESINPMFSTSASNRMNSNDDLAILKTGNVKGLAISLIRSMTSQLEILAPDFFNVGNCTETFSLEMGFKKSPWGLKRSRTSLVSWQAWITLILKSFPRFL